MSVSSRRPLIGIAPRWERKVPTAQVPDQLAPTEGMASCFPDAIIDAGGTPILLPLTDDADAINQLVELCDGFALQGGPDVDPARFGSTEPYDPALL